MKENDTLNFEERITKVLNEASVFSGLIKTVLFEMKTQYEELQERHKDLKQKHDLLLEMYRAKQIELNNNQVDYEQLKNKLKAEEILKTQLMDEKEIFCNKVQALEMKLAQGEDFKKKYEQELKDHERLYKEYGKLKAILAQQKPVEPTTNKPDAQNMIEAIVEFGESYPSNQNDKADVIRQLLAEDVFKEAGLSKDIKKRIRKIGRKEPNANMNINTKSMFDINGNKNVNIGNHEHKNDHE